MERFDIYKPCMALRPYMLQYAISENTAEKEYKVLPGTSLVIGFQYSGRLAMLEGSQQQRLLDVSGITGLQKHHLVFRNSAQIGTLLLYFTETGAAAFFKQPMHELFGQSVSLENFFPASVLSNLQEQLAEAPTDAKRISVAESFLMLHLKFTDADTLVFMAIQYIKEQKGLIRIKELAESLYISQSALEKRFRKIVGATPKKFASLVRLNAIAQAKPDGSLTDWGYHWGYYDQAHFTKDFKQFAGQTPEEFFKQ